MEEQIVKKYKQFTKLINKTYSSDSPNVPFSRNNDGSINFTHNNVIFKLIPPSKITYNEAKDSEKGKWIKETFDTNNKNDDLIRIKELLSKTKNRKEYLSLQKEKYELQSKIYNEMTNNNNWETSRVWGTAGEFSKLKILYRPLTGHHFNREDIKGKWNILTEDDSGNLFEEIEIDYNNLYENCKKLKEEGVLYSDKNIFSRLEKTLNLPEKTLNDYTIFIKDLYNSIEVAKELPKKDALKVTTKDLLQDVKKKMPKKDKPVKESKKKESKIIKKKSNEESKKKCTNRNPLPDNDGNCPSDKPYKRDGCCYKTKKRLKKIGGGWSPLDKRNLFSFKRGARKNTSIQKRLTWKNVTKSGGGVISNNVGCATSNDVYENLGFEEIMF